MARPRAHRQATFAPRGQAMWDELSPGLGKAKRVLLDEACRLADRLDILDKLITGDVETWFRIRDARNDEMPSELIVNAPLAEARMTATALRQIVTELTTSGAPPAPSGGESALDRMQRELAERRAASAVPKPAGQ